MSQFILTKAAIAETEGDQLFSVRLIDRRTGEVPNERCCRTHELPGFTA
ncbi:hypothetical protein [Paracoccus sp. (in: a-proteobacteria)]|nr:hypothetical protein [Paracoccus sp. (in: a-proteobacteria)]